jgi:hypothetical protein
MNSTGCIVIVCTFNCYELLMYIIFTKNISSESVRLKMVFYKFKKENKIVPQLNALVDFIIN